MIKFLRINLVFVVFYLMSCGTATFDCSSHYHLTDESKFMSFFLHEQTSLTFQRIYKGITDTIVIERISEIDDILTFDSDISGENNCSDISLYCDRNAYLYKDSEGSIWRFELFVSNPDVQNFCVIHKKRVVADIGVRCFMCNETTVETATGRFDSVISLKDYIKYKPSDKLSAKYFTDGYGNIIENIPETINSGLYNKKYGLLQLHLFNNTDSNIVYNRIP